MARPGTYRDPYPGQVKIQSRERGSMPQRYLPLRIVMAAFLFASLNGCVNLDDAAGFSKLSDEARVSLPRVSNDIAGPCLRQNPLFENTPAGERPPSAQT